MVPSKKIDSIPKQFWKDSIQAEYVINRIKSSVVPSGKKANFTVSRKGYTTLFDEDIDRFESLISANANWHPEVPEAVREDIVSHAIFSTADKGRLNRGAVSEFIKTQSKSYLNKPLSTYILLLTISIPYSKKLSKISSNGAEITFHKNKPKGFDIDDAVKLANEITDPNILDEYTYVKVKVLSRCRESAYLKAKSEFDFIRGIWNFTLNLGRGIRTTFGIPNRINKIVYGPCYTLHKEDGTRESNLFWYSTHLRRRAYIFDINKDFSNCKKNEKKMIAAVKNHPLGDFIRNTFIRYGNAMDDEDMTTTFLKLWSLLEYLTISENSNHVTTVHRAATIYFDKEIMKVSLNNLREKRNHIVHDDGQFNSGEKDVQILLQIINALIRFELSNLKLFKSKELLSEFLSLPHKEVEFSRIKSENKRQLNKIKIADTIGLYKSS